MRWFSQPGTVSYYDHARTTVLVLDFIDDSLYRVFCTETRRVLTTKAAQLSDLE